MENLWEVRENIKAIQPIEERIAKVNERLQHAQAEVALLLQKYKKECRDVQKIENETLSSYMLKVFGKLEERLEKERREEIQAKVSYDKAMTAFKETKREKGELEVRLCSLQRLAQEYETALENRRKYIKQRVSDADGQQYKQYEDAIDAVIAQKTEIREALKAVANTESTAQDAIDSLESADGWATFDIWTKGGLLTHAAKYSHIDNAEACMHRLASQVNNLQKELRDVHGVPAIDLTQISPAQRIVDFWFDNIFTDISVESQICENIEKLNQLLAALMRAETLLKQKHSEMNMYLDRIKQKQEDLLVSL